MKDNSIVVKPQDNQQCILDLFKTPKLIGLIGDANTGKSNILYWTIKALRDKYHFGLYTYGLRVNVCEEQKIYTVGELETIH